MPPSSDINPFNTSMSRIRVGMYQYIHCTYMYLAPNQEVVLSVQYVAYRTSISLSSSWHRRKTESSLDPRGPLSRVLPLWPSAGLRPRRWSSW